MSREKSIAVTLVVMGLVLGIAAVILDLNGAGSWIHSLTFVGGGSFGYGLVMWIRLAHTKGPFPPADE